MYVDSLIHYLDRDLSMDDIRAMSRDELARLNRLLYHWERITDRELSAVRTASNEEEPE